MTIPGATESEPDSGYARLEQQIRWYDSKSAQAQLRFKAVKVAEFVVSAFVPISALVLDKVATAVAGGVVIVLESLQQLSQWQHNWITYRSTCEALRHEKYSYLARSGVYEELDDLRAKQLLAERVEGLISTEHSKWLSRQEYREQKPPAKSG